MTIDIKTKAFIWAVVVLSVPVLASNLFSAPKNFPSNDIISIEKGSSVLDIAVKLKSLEAIRSKTIFVMAVKLAGAENKIISGDYYFEKPANLFKIIRSLKSGNSDLVKVSVTVPEGSTVKEIADILNNNKNLINFDIEGFVELAKNKEGYLFPDTYFFVSSIKPEDVVNKLNQQFEKKILGLEEKIKQAPHPLSEIIIMASIVEKEVRSLEDKKIVAGILWKRISRGMPLQVDATLHYLIDKTSAELTVDDLKINSPYNTYNRKGLPPTPISNPGEESILATIEPTASPYFFYLTGRDGKTYFAKTFEEHKINKKKYLN